jgi:hypothetical protein
MDARTLEALRGSIAKWEAIVAGTGEDKGVLNCPLCQLFVSGEEILCKGCPVSDATGEIYCNDTPYSDWSELAEDLAYDEHGHLSDKGRRLAQAELDFLKSLLPKDAAQ